MASTRRTLIIILIFVFIPLVILAPTVLHKHSGTQKLPTPSLKALAAKHTIELGNFAILTHLNDPRYSSILSSQFNLALIDNTPNWYFNDGDLRPSPTG